MPNRKLVITRQGKDEELDMNYLSEISAFQDADIAPASRKARKDRLIRLLHYLINYVSPSKPYRAPPSNRPSGEFADIDTDEMADFFAYGIKTIINQLEASEGLSPYRGTKVSTETLERFSRWADGVK